MLDNHYTGTGVLFDLFSLAAECAFQSVIVVCHHHQSLWCMRDNIPPSTIQWAALELEQRTWNALETFALSAQKSCQYWGSRSSTFFPKHVLISWMCFFKFTSSTPPVVYSQD